MAAYLLDTSCLVAAVCGWHEHHEETRADLERRHRRRERAVVAAPSLVEAYSVLTRLPPPHRLAYSEALALLEGNWGALGIVALTGDEYWRLLREAPDDGIGGGRTYDAVIAACARKARVGTLLTWNLDDFLPFAEAVAVVSPRGDRPRRGPLPSARR